MDVVSIDFETYYGDDYTLSKMTTEAYVRDPRFETIMVGLQINDGQPWWVPKPDVGYALRDLNLSRRAVLCHHAHFDGLILSYHYAIYPRQWFDTLSMGRALHGANSRLSLEKLAERYGIGKKGKEVHNVKGMHFADFSAPALARYGLYCATDVDLTYKLFTRMAGEFSRYELEFHDQIIRMFTEPKLRLDEAMLDAYAKQISADKLAIMLQAGVQKDDLMSNEKFAQALISLGVEPPEKISPTWLKKAPADRPAIPPLTYAFSKTDQGMQALQEHPDERVQVLVEARLKNKTTIAEKGAQRLIEMGRRGPATIYLKVSGASGTHRLSGGDKFNWQAMKRGSPIRDAVMAEDGYAIVAGDSSNIEARLLDWLAMQMDMVQVYRDADAKIGPDMYCVMAGRIYKRVITKGVDTAERQFGKIVKLGLGFGMGDAKFIHTVRGQAKDASGKPMVITPEYSRYIVHEVYRAAHPHVVKLWRRCDDALSAISKGLIGLPVDPRGVVRTCKDGLVMPGGLKILYPDLKRTKDEETGQWEWTFWNGKARERIYGAKVCENIIQCLARIIVFAQCMATRKEARAEGWWVHSVHDEGLFLTHLFYAPWLLERLLANMRVSPDWAPDLPLNSEGGFHQRYGKAKQ